MDYMLDFFKFIVKSFGMQFVFIISFILIINLIYMLLQFYFESGNKRKKNNKRNLIVKIKSKIYGINPEIFEKMDKKTAP